MRSGRVQSARIAITLSLLRWVMTSVLFIIRLLFTWHVMHQSAVISMKTVFPAETNLLIIAGSNGSQIPVKSALKSGLFSTIVFGVHRGAVKATVAKRHRTGAESWAPPQFFLCAKNIEEGASWSGVDMEWSRYGVE